MIKFKGECIYMTYNIVPEKTAIKNGVSNSAKLISHKPFQFKELSVLDYGCGKLRNSKFLLNEGFKVSILDTQKQLQNISHEELLLFHEVYEAESISFNRKYPAILCSFVLNVIPSNDIRIEILNNIHEFLTEDGFAYIEVRGTGFLKGAKTKTPYSDGYVLGNGENKTFQKGFTKDTLSDLISESQLKLWEVHKFGDSLVAICKK